MAVYIVDSHGSLSERVCELAGTLPAPPDVHVVSRIDDIYSYDLSSILILIPEELAATIPDAIPDRSVAVYSSQTGRSLFDAAGQLPQIAAIIGRSAEQPPRSWEILMLFDRVLKRSFAATAAQWCFPSAPQRHQWTISSTDELEQSVERLSEFACGLGLSRRLVTRITGVAHEMFMNALYDAPVDAEGKPVYAYSRTERIQVAAADSAHVLCAQEGTAMFLEVSDRFGGLRRQHVFGSLARGFRSADPGARQEEFIDSSHGGAGLGIHRILTGANATIFEVARGRQTRQTAFFDLAVDNRNLRTASRSLYFFSQNAR